MIQLETVPNTTATGFSALSQLFIVVFAATVSLSLPLMTLAQQSTKQAQQIQTAIQLEAKRFGDFRGEASLGLCFPRVNQCVGLSQTCVYGSVRGTALSASAIRNEP